MRRIVFTHIVVALDGSPEAETILPYVEAIARPLDARVTFVCALVPVDQTFTGEMALAGAAAGAGSPGPLYDAHDALGSDDSSYLASLRRRWVAAGFDVECREPEMRAADAILEVAREEYADLIAMATHGRSGLDRAVKGSVADDVVRAAPCPVLLVRDASEV